VRAIRELLASIVARECYRQHYGDFGLLGSLSQPLVVDDGGYRLSTDLGHIEVRDFTPVPFITYGITSSS